MIERYFMEGVRYAWSAPGAIAGPQDGTLVDSKRAPTPLVYIGLDSIVDPRLKMHHVSTFGLTMRMNIPYRWCDYVLGQTSRARAGTADILTGFMSGCKIARWTEAGQTYVGHVGTVMNPTVDARVKANFAAVMSPTTTGFDPSAAWAPELPALIAKHKKAYKVVALVTATGEFYSIVMLVDNVNVTEWVCGGIKKVPPMNRAALEASLR